MRTDDLLLQDMLEAIGEILENTPENRDAYNENKLLRSHLVRNIQIIGEAGTRISTEIRDANPCVPWRAIIGMRHVVVHDYFEIDWNAVYETAINDVPPLKPLIEGIITDLQNKQP